MTFMVERGHFDHMGIADGKRENILTYNDVFELVKPHTTVPFEGERGVKAMQEKFRGTFFDRALGTLRPREAVPAEELQDALNMQLHGGEEEKRDSISVFFRRVQRPDKDGWSLSDGKFHMDWQGRATAYRLAADQAVGGLPVDDLDMVPVTFTPALTNPHEFVLYEYREDVIRDLTLLQEGAMQIVEEDYGWAMFRKVLNDRELAIMQEQYRAIEQDTNSAWVDRAALAFLSVREEAAAPPGSKDRKVVVRESDQALQPGVLPADLFDVKKVPRAGWEPAIFHFIYAAMPTDLSVPENLNTWYGFYPDVFDEPQDDGQPL